MKILLSITITIKDYFPKESYIPYENFVCLFINNNFNSKIRLSNLSNQNFIKHKIESNNSNIIYNLHVLDSFKNSLIGIYHLIINFDKIKNLNINDTLTQEETAKLIIDSNTKRKIFDKITNIGDIYLILSTEIKILDKKIFASENRENNNSLIKKGLSSDNNVEINEFNLTPRTFKKKQIIQNIINDREALKRIENISNNNEVFMNNCILDENEFENETCTTGTLKKYKSLNEKKILNKNSTKYSELYSKNTYFNNSCTEISSPKHSNTYFNFKKEEKKKPNKKKKQAPKKKVTILDLMEKKIDLSLYKEKEENTFDLNTQSKDLKNNFNYNKIQKNNNMKKKSFTSLTNNQFSFKLKKKLNVTTTKNLIKNMDEKEFLLKKNNNKNKISVNLSKKDINEKKVSKKNYKIVNNKKNLNDAGRLNKDIHKIDFRKFKNSNNIFLQTDTTMKKISERYIDLKKDDIKSHTLTDIDLKKLILEKNNFIKEKFQDKYLKQMNSGAFSPKLSLKVKFSENEFIYNERNEKNNNKYIKLNKKILTPKNNPIRKVSFSNDDNLAFENEELKKKCFNIIDFFSLLNKKLKKAFPSNIEYCKKNELIREKYNNLKKYKNKLVQIKNSNEFKKINSHSICHFEEEQLLNKMINIKFQENFVYQNIFYNLSDEQNIKNKIDILLIKKKEMFLSLVKNIIKFYGNVSQIYNNDLIKKKLFIKLLDKYNIKEKINTDLNYINYIHKGSNFVDKIITEVDEDKENEEEDEEELEKNSNISSNNNEDNKINEINIENKENININKNLLKNNFEEMDISLNNNQNENKIINDDNISDSNNNNGDKNLNNLINRILIDQFPENYKTNMKFIHQDNNRYLFENKIFLAFIKDNDVVLKEEINDEEDNMNNGMLTLNEFYKKYCLPEKKENKVNFIYTKKIRQKYIKLKSNDKDEQSIEKKIKNENSTTIETEKKTM